MKRDKIIKVNYAEAGLDFYINNGTKNNLVGASYGKIGHKFGEYVFTKKMGKKIHTRKDDDKKKKNLKKGKK